jgi:ribosome-binding protein aMBF1 (putative translation factor)
MAYDPSEKPMNGNTSTEQLMEFRREFGAKVREIREMRRISREEMAAKLDIKLLTLDKIEKGRMTISTNDIFSIKTILQFDIVLEVY